MFHLAHLIPMVLMDDSQELWLDSIFQSPSQIDCIEGLGKVCKGCIQALIL